jgi:hypothetical protein
VTFIGYNDCKIPSQLEERVKMSEIYGQFANRKEKKDARTSISMCFLAAVILLLAGAIWQTAALGLVFGVLISAIYLAIALFSPPLITEEDIEMR